MKNPFENVVLAAAVLCAAGVVSSLHAAESASGHYEDRMQEIVVTAALETSVAETALPVNVLSGEELLEKVGNSLGDTLKNEIGTNSASYGPGVGQPIVRGQTGSRVMVLQNGVGVTDVYSLSPDHVNAAEAQLAERVEVVRGPATLLYGSGAIGGVVNVIDNRVPETLVASPEFVIQQTHNTVNEENKTIVRLDASAGNFAFHLDAFRRENDNVGIKGFAIDEMAVERLEELVAEHFEEEHHEEGHHEEEDHHDDDHQEEEELENTRGFIGNSDAESDGGTLGFSWVGDNGFVGFSVNHLNNAYGLPPGTHTHSHHHQEEEHHEEQEHHEEDHDGEEEEHGDEVEFVRLDMESRRYDLRGKLELTGGWVESVRGSVGFTDYEHSEIEFFEDGGSVVGTLYSNEGMEGRFVLTHVPAGNWTGSWGYQFIDTELSTVGEEGFIPQSDVSSHGLFGVERFRQGNITAELGLRLEENRVKPNGGCGFSSNASSLSGSLLYDLSRNSNLLVGLSRSERTPSVGELFSNVSVATCARPADDEDLVAHVATGLLEIGNPDLGEETSNNFEVGYRLHSGPITGEISAFLNEVDDYIFLEFTGEEHEEQQVAGYLAKDAEFRGVEGRVTFDLIDRDNTSLILGLFGDVVNAELAAGGNVPRIPAAKLGGELRYSGSDWSVHLRLTEVLEQDDAAELEFATDGYTLVSLYADYHWSFGNDSELKLFLRGDNLLDDEVRNHASFLKNYAPEPGRGVTLGLRLDY